MRLPCAANFVNSSAVGEYMMLLAAVDVPRWLELGLGDVETVAACDRPEKAGFISFVTGRAGLLHLDEQGVAIAIEGDIFDSLRVTAGLAFHPKCLARAAPEMRLAGGDRFFERSTIHPRHHQHPAGRLFLDD